MPFILTVEAYADDAVFLTIVPILAKSNFPKDEGQQALFPKTFIWYSDISSAPLDEESSHIINWLEQKGG